MVRADGLGDQRCVLVVIQVCLFVALASELLRRSAGLAHLELTRSPTSRSTTHTPPTHETHTQPRPRPAPAARPLLAACTRAPVQGTWRTCVLIAARALATPQTLRLPLDASLLYVPLTSHPYAAPSALSTRFTILPHTHDLKPTQPLSPTPL